jgi:arylsulfatase
MEAETPAKYSMNGDALEKLPTDFYSSRSYTDFLMDAVRESREEGKPFFAYLALSSPHDPVQVPEPWLSKYRGRYDKGYNSLKTERAKNAMELGLVPAGSRISKMPRCRRASQSRIWRVKLAQMIDFG